ncbi:hypothetical protein X757_07785 [Mesorhizobium sp. LSHC414A00]|nr:hypothetical protein X757_07785 [Mesorhizobium sp. LSHC414A00]
MAATGDNGKRKLDEPDAIKLILPMLMPQCPDHEIDPPVRNCCSRSSYTRSAMITSKLGYDLSVSRTASGISCARAKCIERAGSSSWYGKRSPEGDNDDRDSGTAQHG